MFHTKKKTLERFTAQEINKIVMFKIKRPTTIHRCFLSYQTYTCGISHKLSTCAPIATNANF